MNREILFKAKRKNWRELPKEEWWVEGNLITNERQEGTAYIGYIFDVHNGIIEDFDIVEIDPETLCQYIGLTDKNGKRIWENDFGAYNKCGAIQRFVDPIVGTKPDWCPIKSVPLSLACSRLIEELNKKEDFYNAFRDGIINSIKDPDTMSYPEPEDIADKIIKRITGD